MMNFGIIVVNFWGKKTGYSDLVVLLEDLVEKVLAPVIFRDRFSSKI